MIGVEVPMFKCPDGNVIQFYEMPVANKAQSDQHGRPIFWRWLIGLVTSPAMKNQKATVPIRLMDAEGKIVKRTIALQREDGQTVWNDELYKDQIDAWNKGRTGDGIGTPLETWPRLNDVSVIATLHAVGVRSLEQLAAVPDGALAQIGPNGRQLRDGAAKFMEAAEGNAPMERLIAEKEEMKEQIALLMKQVDELTAPKSRKARDTEPAAAAA